MPSNVVEKITLTESACLRHPEQAATRRQGHARNDLAVRLERWSTKGLMDSERRIAAEDDERIHR